MMKFTVLMTLTLLPMAFLSTVSHAEQSNDAVCRVLKKQATSAATYIPGLDVYGRPVVAAEGDLPALTGDLPTRIKVPLSIDLAQMIPSLQNAGLEMNSDLGVIEVDGQGRVYKGDENITDAVTEHCDLPSVDAMIMEQQMSNNGRPPQNLFNNQGVEMIAPAAGEITPTINGVEVERLSAPSMNAPLIDNAAPMNDIGFDEIDELLFDY